MDGYSSRFLDAFRAKTPCRRCGTALWRGANTDETSDATASILALSHFAHSVLNFCAQRQRAIVTFYCLSLLCTEGKGLGRKDWGMGGGDRGQGRDRLFRFPPPTPTPPHHTYHTATTSPPNLCLPVLPSLQDPAPACSSDRQLTTHTCLHTACWLHAAACWAIKYVPMYSTQPQHSVLFSSLRPSPAAVSYLPALSIHSVLLCFLVVVGTTDSPFLPYLFGHSLIVAVHML